MLRHLTLIASALLALSLGAAELSATGNLLTNADFSEGRSGWWSSTSKTMVAAGCTQRPENGRWVADIPEVQDAESTGVLLGNGVKLERGRTYRLSYTLTLEKPGTMRHLYQMSKKPHRPLGLVENVPVTAGTNDVVTTFTCALPDPGMPAHITFNLSRLTGRVAISDFALQEIATLPVSHLNSSWTAFIDVKPPASSASVPASLEGTNGLPVSPQMVELANGGIDVAALNNGVFRTRARAVLFNEFTSTGPAVMQVGVSADWWMDVSVNGKPVYSTLARGNGSHQYSPNDHVIELPVEEGRNVLAVQILSGSKGWRLVCGTPDPPITYTANDEWKAVDMASTQIAEGSALDLSSLVDTPAGRHGRVAIGDDGSLVFTDVPGQPIRMLGFNGFPSSIWTIPDNEAFRSQVRLFARAARRQGYCLFRVHGLLDRWLCLGATEDMSIQPKQLDRWDYLLSEFKREGIYCHLVIFSFGLYERSAARATTFEERDKHKLHLYLGGEWERTRFRYGAETLLNHVNPYTGLAWKDDPAIAFVEFYNEQELGLERMGKTLVTFPETRAFLEREWRTWLVARHGNDVPPQLLEELNGTALADAPVPQVHDRQSELANQFALFRMHIATQSAEWCEQVIRGIGYAGLTTQYNASKKLGESAVRWRVSQVTDMHAYYRHPIGGWGAAGTHVNQNSSLADAAGYWRNMNSTRLSGRPFIVSEFNHCFWNPYQHEGGLVFGAYAALQGFSALQIHSGPVTLAADRPKVGSFTCGASPVVRASEFLSACLFRRGDVAPAAHRVELVVPEKTLTTGGTSLGAVSTEQSKLALMTGFSLAFPWADRAPGTAVGRTPDMRLLPSGVAQVDAQDWFVNVIESPDGNFSLADAVTQMKSRGLLPTANTSNPAAGIYQSDTGEIVMRSLEHLLKVTTPRTEAVSLEAGKSEAVGVLEVESSSVPACIALCSVSGEPLATARRMVLVYSTEMVNTDMVVGYDRRLMKNTGRSPALMRCGKLSVTLTRTDTADLSVYALGYDGRRREQVATSRTDKGIRIRLDTAALADGPTPFFELVHVGRRP